MDESGTTTVAGSEAVPSSKARENTREEINLVDYVSVLWKYKYLILLGCVVPTLIVGLSLFFRPDCYSATYTYSDLDFDGEAYEIFLSRFYSASNLQRLNKLLIEGNPGGSAASVRVANGGVNRSASSTVRFEVWPEYIQSAKLRLNSADEAERIQRQKADLLRMIIVADSEDRIYETASVIRTNVENVMPLLDAEKGLRESISMHRTRVADIETGRFGIELSLTTNKAVLAKLKNMKPAAVGGSGSDVALQFNIGSNSEYLPLGYYVQATETKIVELEEKIQESEKTYSYHQYLVSVDEQILSEIVSNTAGDYTIQDFHSFLTDLQGTVEKPEVRDYLASYTKKIENDMLLRIPVTQMPQIRLDCKSIRKQTTVAFIIALLVSTFSAFLLEGIRGATRRS